MAEMIALVVGLVAKYPIVATILMIMGIMRAVFKPIFSVARAYVDATSSPSDNLVLDGIESGKVVKTLSWILDFLGSIKVGPQASK